MSLQDPAGSRANMLFHVGLAMLLCHELDAVMHAEWRVLPVTSWLPDDAGYVVFVLAHLPLFALLTWALTHPSGGVRNGTRLGLSAFMVVHAGLHLAFHGHAEYHFAGWLSHGLVAGAAAAGAVYLLMRWRYRTVRASPA